MAMAQNVQIPARKPAVVPQARFVLASAKNIARFTAIINENKAAKPKVRPLLLAAICSAVKLLSFIQAVPNNAGEYQMPPKAKAEMPATITASQLIVEMSMIF